MCVRVCVCVCVCVCGVCEDAFWRVEEEEGMAWDKVEMEKPGVRRLADVGAEGELV